MTESSATTQVESEISAASSIGPRAAVSTLGCKVNTYESNLIAQGLSQEGWRLVDDRKKADLYVINSCTVTAEADRQTRQHVRRVLKRNPNAVVVVTGCYAQVNGAALAAIDGVRLVVGNDRKLAIPQMARDLTPGQGTEVLVGALDDRVAIESAPLSGFRDRSRAFVQVQQGCDQACTFCVIHTARGPSRSFSYHKILNQVAKLISTGFREIVICGVDLGAYGLDLSGGAALEAGQGLVQLLEGIKTVPGDFRVRLSSIDPVHVSNELLRLMKNDSRMCPHLHVSMQSGNSLILKRMKRRYDAAYLYACLSAAREQIPDLVLGADVMVGFPTESIDQFGDTLAAIHEFGIAFPHIFSYSPRPGTPAARIPKQIPSIERQRRSAVLRAAGREILDRSLESWRGRRSVVLLERPAGQGKLGHNARLANYMPVRIDAQSKTPGQFLEAVVTGVDNGTLIAEAVPRE
jgi:threonylcarbamoyladenosine tRNA methylthiotransferase MtaB